MGKDKKSKSRRSKRSFTKRRTTKAKIGFETLMLGVGHVVVQPADGWASTPLQHLESGNMNELLYTEVKGWTGLDIYPGGTMKFGLSNINPLDMSNARYWKMIFWGEIFGKIRRKFAPSTSKLFKKIPLVGNWVK